MLPNKIQHIINKLPKAIQETIGLVISFFEQKLKEKDRRIQELEGQLSKNSQNSSKPPSTDKPFDKPCPKSRRVKTGKKVGGQKDHKGTTLKMVATPDEYKYHQVSVCSNCGDSIADTPIHKIVRRQVYDIPLLSVKVVEHQSAIKICSCGCQNSNFPPEASHYVQYGPRLKGLMVYLQNYQLLPYGRTSELIADLFGHKISCGTLHNTQKNAYDKLGDYKSDIIRFAKNFSVPFDNNFSERDIRMMKLKQKISGCFRSKQGAQYFARIRSFIVSARKQNRNSLDDLTNIFQNNSAWSDIVNFSYTE